MDSFGPFVLMKTVRSFFLSGEPSSETMGSTSSWAWLGLMPLSSSFYYFLMSWFKSISMVFYPLRLPRALLTLEFLFPPILLPVSLLPTCEPPAFDPA